MKFRMVDKIISFEPRKNICGIKTVSFEEYQLKSVFADEPQLPQSLLMESLFQLGNWLVMVSSGFSQMGLLVRTDEIRFINPLKPGENVLMKIQVRSYRKDGILFDGQALVNQEIIASGTGCLAAPVELAEYFNPEDLKVLFSEIFQPRDISRE